MSCELMTEDLHRHAHTDAATQGVYNATCVKNSAACVKGSTAYLE